MVAQPEQPTPASNSCAGIPAEQQLAGLRRPEGEAGSCPLLCPDLMASWPQLNPECLFVWIQDYRARAGPGPLSHLLTGTQKSDISVSPGNG